MRTVDHASLPHAPGASFEAFARAARRAERLTAAGERALAERSAAGDALARRRLVEAHLPLALFHAGRFRGLGVPDADLAQEAVVGLLQAIDRFDPAAGSRLAAYASPWIRAALAAAVQRSGPVRLPTRVARRARQERPAAAAPAVPLDAPGAEDGRPLAERLPGAHGEAMLEALVRADDIAAARRAVAALAPRDAEVVRLRFGL
ncbi:MAG TPA: sigma-70 family RNA polymerase sigma factor, partial [Capillimicrobium sp.]